MRLFRRHLETADLGLSLLDPPNGPAAAHLESCSACRRRRDLLAARLDATRDAARLAADAAFTPADLERQRQSILQRIGRLGAAARVLPFPAAAPATYRSTPPAADRRWVLAAAAAGLLLGIAVGRLPGAAGPTPGTAPVAPAPLMATAEAVSDPRRDDLLLGAVEEVLTRETRPEFEALDGLTPVAYEAR